LGHLKEHVYAVPPRSIEDLGARVRAAVREVLENALRRTAVCLAMDGGRLVTTKRSWFDHFIACAF
jgi:hypothetical protein